jgi:hypothetical protein
MPIQIAKTISTDARNTLVRNRDALQQKHGVQIFFPKSLVRGDKQDMIIKGGAIATTNAEREIDHILIGWRQEFEAFKQRQAYRKAQRRIAATEQPTYFPTIAEACSKSKTLKPKSNNPFAVLEQHDDTPVEPAPEPKTKSAPKPKTLSGWATVAAKGTVKTKPKETPKLKVPSKIDQIQRLHGVLWGDIAMMDDSDDEDYDDQVAMSQLDNWRLNDREDFTTVDWSEAW